MVAPTQWEATLPMGTPRRAGGPGRGRRRPAAVAPVTPYRRGMGTAPWASPDPARRIRPAPPEPRRYDTPTGQCCLRSVRVDGTVAGSGDCCACGTCLLVAERAWG